MYFPMTCTQEGKLLGLLQCCKCEIWNGEWKKTYKETPHTVMYIAGATSPTGEQIGVIYLWTPFSMTVITNVDGSALKFMEVYQGIEVIHQPKINVVSRYTLPSEAGALPTPVLDYPECITSGRIKTDNLMCAAQFEADLEQLSKPLHASARQKLEMAAAVEDKQFRQMNRLFTPVVQNTIKFASVQVAPDVEKHYAIHYVDGGGFMLIPWVSTFNTLAVAKESIQQTTEQEMALLKYSNIETPVCCIRKDIFGWRILHFCTVTTDTFNNYKNPIYNNILTEVP